MCNLARLHIGRITAAFAQKAFLKKVTSKGTHICGHTVNVAPLTVLAGESGPTTFKVNADVVEGNVDAEGRSIVVWPQ